LLDPATYARTQTAPQTTLPAPTLPLQRPASTFDDAVRDILEGHEADDVKAKKYSMILNKFRVRNTKGEVEDVIDGIEEEEILDSIPLHDRYKARRLLRAIKENPELELSERGELNYRQYKIPKSNIIDLIEDILKRKKSSEYRPIGWEEFAEGLAASREIKQDIVTNVASWRLIEKVRNPPPPKRGKSKRKRQGDPINWEEY